MKRILFLLCIAGSLLLACSCGQKETEQAEPAAEPNQQVCEAAYQVDENWNARSVRGTSRLSNSRETFYVYDGYRLSVVFSAKYSGGLEEALEKEKARSGALFGAEPEDARAAKETDVKIGEVSAKQQAHTWKVTGASSVEPQEPGETGHSITTAFQTEMGIYTLKGECYSDKAYETMKREYRKVMDSLVLTDRAEPEVFAEHVGQAGGFVFSLPDWDTRTDTKNGLVIYTMEDALEALEIQELGHEKLNRALMEKTVKDRVLPAISKELKPDIELIKLENVDSALGSAVRAELELTAGQEGEKKTDREKLSAVFLRDKDGKAECCISAPYDEGKYDYAPILNSLTYAKAVEDKVDGLWENKLKYVGDHVGVGRLLQETDFPRCGPYTIELDTKEEPYGLAVCYTNPVENFKTLRLEQEAVYLLGLIENLDYVEIRSGGDAKRYTCGDASSSLKYDVKKLAKDKADLMRYALTRVHEDGSLKSQETLKGAGD